MIKNHAEDLKEFMVNANDRKYQFWERNPMAGGQIIRAKE